VRPHLIALAVALTANAAANLLIRAGMRGRALDLAEPGAVLRGIVLNPLVLGGLALFALNVVSYAYVLSRVPLSIAYPIMTSAGFLIVVTASSLLFHETLAPVQIAGAVVILVGVAMVASRLA
jgi:multidrug transporter EmrE-like cation transporter